MTVDNPYKILQKELKQLWEIVDITCKWSNQNPYTFDEIPYIGEILPNVHIPTGFIVEQFIKGHIQRNCSSKCTHLGCKTRWSEIDQTYDCPCHGSRYYKDGSIMEGPAVYPLQFE